MQTGLLCVFGMICKLYTRSNRAKIKNKKGGINL